MKAPSRMQQERLEKYVLKRAATLKSYVSEWREVPSKGRETGGGHKEEGKNTGQGWGGA